MCIRVYLRTCKMINPKYLLQLYYRVFLNKTADTGTDIDTDAANKTDTRDTAIIAATALT